MGSRLRVRVFVVVRFIARSEGMSTGNKLPYYKPVPLKTKYLDAGKEICIFSVIVVLLMFGFNRYSKREEERRQTQCHESVRSVANVR